MVFWLKLRFPWRYGLLLRTGWGSSPSADGYGPRWPGSGPLSRAVGVCLRETGNRGKRVRAAAEAFHLVLSSFARMRGAGEGKLVLDRAGWHTSRQVQVPEGVGFVFCHPTRLSCSRWSEPGG
jgi:hypothetical protein